MKVLILGSNGLVGSSLKRILSQSSKIINVVGATRKDADLFEYGQTNELFKKTNPDIIVNAAARVGGIHANNSQRTLFITQNLKINLNIIESLKEKPHIKLINLGSSCIYPVDAENPIKEDSLMTGPLEPTNSPYALAKISAIEMGRALNHDFGNQVINLMPTNLYGPNDFFHESLSHVIPGMMLKMHKAKIKNEKTFSVWGTGKPLREFLYVDDLSYAVNHILNIDTKTDLINVGSSKEISISKLSLMMKEIIGYEGDIIFDSTKPDGNPRKLLDSEKILNLGWSPKTNLKSGLINTYNWFKNYQNL